MTVGMATVAFAAPSPAATTGTVSEATDKNGNKVEVTVSDNFTAAEQPAVNEIKKDAAAVLEEVVPAVNAADYKLATVKEVTVPAGTVFPVKITFNVDGVTAGSKVIVLHYTYNCQFPLVRLVDRSRMQTDHRITKVRIIGTDRQHWFDCHTVNIGHENTGNACFPCTFHYLWQIFGKFF